VNHPALGYALDAFVIAVMGVLLALGACEVHTFLAVVAPIVGARVFLTRNGGPPPGGGTGLATSAAFVLFCLPLSNAVSHYFGHHGQVQ
jgi:hypothetical protein